VFVMSKAKPPDVRSIRLLVLDVDGVLTDGTVLLDGSGGELQRFAVEDGLGIRLWRETGGQVAICSGRATAPAKQRAADFGVDIIEEGLDDKLAGYRRILEKTGRTDAETCMMGDDLLDGPAMKRCALAIAPANAADEIKRIAGHVTTRRGGEGAVRQAVEFLLKKQGRWQDALRHIGLSD
jgi:3-deoxy-D-manno-octulosonate 8-phosphate phosphatase (KDO 8-P phosphatase)